MLAAHDSSEFLYSFNSLNHEATSLWDGNPLSMRPSRTRASGCRLLMRSVARETPLPPLVANGATIFPARSTESRKLSTMRGSAYHQMGKPTNTTS